MGRASRWCDVLAALLLFVGGCGSWSCQRPPEGASPSALVEVYEGPDLWALLLAETGAWVAHELVDDVRIWRHRGGRTAVWSRRGRWILLNGRRFGANLVGLSSREAAGWLGTRRGWNGWVVMEARAMGPAVLGLLRSAPVLGLALVGGGDTRGSAPGYKDARWTWRLRGLRGLAGSLEALSLKGWALGAADMRILAELPGLRGLSLSGARVAPGGLRWLGRMRSLRLLDLTGVRLRGARFLQGLVELRWLGLGGTGVADADLEDLSSLRRLKVLDLSRNPIGDFGVERISSMESLRALDLADSTVTDLGLDLVARLGSLRMLAVGPWVTDLGLAHLKDLTRLEALGLRRAGVTDAGLAHLANMLALRRLDLAWTAVTPRGVGRLRRLPLLVHLGLEWTRAAGTTAAQERGAR